MAHHDTIKRPLFTSFEEKRQWLDSQMRQAERQVWWSEARGEWRLADNAEQRRAAYARELEQHEANDMACSIPRHQRAQ